MAGVHPRSALTRSRFRRNGAGYGAPLVGSLFALAMTLIGPWPLLAEPFPGLQRNPNKATASRAARDDAVRSIPFDKLDAQARAKVASVLQDVSFFRRMPIRVTQCDPELYVFLVHHPDVIVNIWQVLGVTRVTMQENGPDTFWVTDPAGTKGTVDYLYSDHDTQVIYTQGSYDGPLFTRPVKGRGLVVLKSGWVREPDGRYYVTSRMDAFMRVEHLGAEILTRTFQPLVGKVADINFTYTAEFLGKLSRTAEKNGDGVERLAGKLTAVQPEVRREFAQVARRVAEKSVEISRRDPDHPPQVASRPAPQAVEAPGAQDEP
jgi:hypothetical protein